MLIQFSPINPIEKIIYTHAFPSVGSPVEPIILSWFVLNKYPINPNITTPNADNTVQNQALAGYNQSC